MKTIKQTAKGSKHVGIFFHVDKKAPSSQQSIQTQ